MSSHENPDPRRNRYEFTQPHYPRMAELGERVRTYLQNWPNNTDVPPCQFADAGFFFLGFRDRVKCFYCNGSLQQWHTDDEPWFEHAKAFPTCGYVILRKGPQFVQDVLQTVSGETGFSRFGNTRSTTQLTRRSMLRAPQVATMNPHINGTANIRNIHQPNNVLVTNLSGDRCAFCAFVKSHAVVVLIFLAFAFALFLLSRF